MLRQVKLYLNTIRYLKPSQYYYRLSRRMFKRLFSRVKGTIFEGALNLSVSFVIPELDFDGEFLNRHDPVDIVNGYFSFLHTRVKFSADSWRDEQLDQLWRYNLHYFDYVFPLAFAYSRFEDQRFFKRFRELALCWINENMGFVGDGWHPYTISLRVCNWICCYQLFSNEFCRDADFEKEFLNSLYSQYQYLLRNLEKDVLGNHYLENIRAIICGSIFFREDRVLQRFVRELENQTREQILPDGMHFELSPMYHKLMLEGLIKMTHWITQTGRDTTYLQSAIQRMADCVFSLEKNTGITPLFNDSGDNVAKSVDALLTAADRLFGIVPSYRTTFKESGYYILEKGNTKIIVDSGKTCPDYLPAHGHCDALSYELFVDGHPVVVNSGTYCYSAGNWREFFRSTRAHNTLLIGDAEQSECWGRFRVARRQKPLKAGIGVFGCYQVFRGAYRNYRGNVHERLLCLLEEDTLLVIDKVNAKKGAKSFIHFHPDYKIEASQSGNHVEIFREGIKVGVLAPINVDDVRVYYGDEYNGWYSPEFGLIYPNYCVELRSTPDIPFTGYVVTIGDAQPIVIAEGWTVQVEHDGSIHEFDVSDLGKWEYR